MIRGFSRGAAFGLLFIVSSLAAQDQSGVVDKIQQCGDIEDTDERLACYDRIGRSQAAEMPDPGADDAGAPLVSDTPVDATPEASEAAEGQQSVDDFGLPKDADDFGAIEATVARCGESNNRKFYFYLDNGQVWQYIGVQNPRRLDCEGPATLTEDSFGFKLHLQGKPDLRVRRVR